MDSVSEIKARLPIEQLVGQYAQLQKKGRNLVCLCPFHQDSHPSLLVSPDKGIAYCFACQSGGDIFSFYQKIEGVDFPQALRDLAEKAGVTLEERPAADAPKKGEKERARECLQASLKFFQAQLAANNVAQEYLKKRAVPAEQIEEFQLGYAPDSFSATYEHLLKSGFSRKEILSAGMAVQRDLQEERMYDRFRHRLIFPIHDTQGQLVAFGGRTLGDDDAKYLNSNEGILYHKANVLFGFHQAKDTMRDKKSALVVEGYFDVLACHRVGVKNVVAASGTAFTEQHAKLLKRYCETVVLCLDQDRAGQDAAERAYHILTHEDLFVESIVLPTKDPAEMAESEPQALQEILQAGGMPYIDYVFEQMKVQNPQSAMERKKMTDMLISLLASMGNLLMRTEYTAKIAQELKLRFGMAEEAFRMSVDESVRSGSKPQRSPERTAPVTAVSPSAEIFSTSDITLGMFLIYPSLVSLLSELVRPEEEFGAALHTALSALGDRRGWTIADLELSEEFVQRAGILALYCEHHGFNDWSESMAVREIRKNCKQANHDMLKKKAYDITRKLLVARAAGQTVEEAELSVQYQQVLGLMQKAGQ